eukprot:m.5353 g.5353  ORF g.5353 m.5353 type:complete len:619 (+) comp3281_c0_seq1:104-1960(+)
MKCVILVAGHQTRLEDEVRTDSSGRYKHLVGVPKALFPVISPGGKREGRTLLDSWWEAIRLTNAFEKVYLVTNADKYKHYERWATSRGFPRENVINDGTTANTGGLGAVADFELALRCKGIDTGDVMVVSGDMLFEPKRFDIFGITEFFRTHNADLACYYEMADDEDASKRGILELDKDKLLTRFVEKPKKGETASRLASIVLFVFKQKSMTHIQEFLAERKSPDVRSFGHLMEWLVPKTAVMGMKLPEVFKLIGSVGLKEYEECIQPATPISPRKKGPKSFTCRTCARVGLLGNPSDGFNGKTISLSIANFWAEATIVESENLELKPHPLNDPTSFGSLADLHCVSVQEGYQGGLRLMQATCKKFYEFCAQNGIAIARNNFTLSYDTNIPRQVGLAGSSAIVTSTLKCLMKFFNVTNSDIPKPVQPNFVLSVEMNELGINAGLQDRVIQAYSGLVYMDFSKELMEKLGYGKYIELDSDLLPPLWLAYLGDPSDSGKIHNDVRKRFDNGDEEVMKGMRTFADITDRGKQAIEAKDYGALADLMDENFALRHTLYGDAGVGLANLKMINIAKKHGSAAKFSGSGGAVVGMCRDTANLDAIQKEMQSSGFVFVLLKANKP